MTGKDTDMKPVIGILGSFNEKDQFIFLNDRYWNAVLRSGGYPILLPYADSAETAADMLSRIDGLLFAGGDDINPSFYNEQTLPCCGDLTPRRDISEQFYVHAWDQTDLPCFGICRGIQALNVFLGGSLWQDIPSQVPNSVQHRKAVHNIRIKEGTLLSTLAESSEAEVNSYHHQAVKECAPSVIPLAWSPDNIVEAIGFVNHRNAIAVQHHPELTMEAKLSSNLFSWFIKEASK